MSDLLPFLSTTNPQSIVASANGVSITATQLVGEIHALADRLPEQAYLLNACHDRYRFIVGLGAALLRGQVTVLPHNHTEQTMNVVRERYGDVACLVDHSDMFSGLRPLLYPPDLNQSDIWPPPSIPAEQAAACLSTSGSTGTPTWHERRWGQMVNSAHAGARALGIQADQTWSIVATVPSQHSYGIESAILLPLQANGRLHRESLFYPADIMDALSQMPSPRLLVTTPVHLRAMVSGSGSPTIADNVLSATAPLSDDLAREAERFFGAPVSEIFGSTESGQTATRRTLDGPTWKPMAGVRIWSDASGNSFADCHVGTAVPLGDRLDVAVDGRFQLQGRHSDMLNVAGKRGSRTFIEEQILAIDGVTDAVVVVDEQRDNYSSRVIAFVVAAPAKHQNILATIRQSIEPAFVPRPVHFVNELPRNPTGKLTHADLNTLIQRHSRPNPPV